MSLSVIKAGALALACASTAFGNYVLAPGDDYSGLGFFDKFDFKYAGELDPSNGFVQYQDYASAKGTGDKYLVKYDETTGANYMGVDYWTKNPTNGRASVRIETKSTYQHGLFIVDLAHMPSSTCGLWPAFWTASHVDYPKQGEIDILENIHKNTVSLQTLHTYPNCNITGNAVVAGQMTGVEDSYNCDDSSQVSDYGSKFQYLNQGCSATNSDANSYGDTFNNAKGGVYAMEWRSDVIQIWNWESGNIPKDITSGKPVPSGWGTPAFTTASSSCVIDNFFKDHHVIFNTDFCGSWAGQSDIWKNSGCYDDVLYPTCASYVAANPDKYKDAYWSINSLKVYQDKKETTSSSSTASSASLTASTTSASITASATASVISTLSVPYGNSTITGGGSGGSKGQLTTSTVYGTTTYTITSCAPTVTNCPVGSVTTETIALYTTVCPVATPVASTTSTVYGTTTYTVTSCAPTMASCSVGSVTTETIALYTSVCPVSAAATTVPYPPAKAYTGTTVDTTTYTITSCAPSMTNCPGKIGKVTTEVITKTKVYQYTPSVVYSYGVSGSGSVAKTTAGGVSSPSASPIAGAASGLRSGSGVLAFGALVAMLI